MGMFEVTAPDGRKFRITAPEGATREQALEYAKEQYGFMSWNNQEQPDTSAENAYSGSILPFSRDSEGKLSFDSDAGFLGPLKRTVMLPGQVLKGEINPTSPEGISRSVEAALMMTPTSPASRGRVLGNRAFKTPEKKVPSRAELKKATDEGYSSARAMGAEYKPEAMTKWADDMARALDEDGYIEPNYPEVHALLKTLRTAPDEAVSVRLEAIDAAYKQLGQMAGSPDKAKARAAAIVQNNLDEFHSSLGPKDIVAGTTTPEVAASTLREARGNAAAGFRSDRITGMEKTSARRTAAANSGRNTDNNIRQRLTSLIESQKGSRGLSEAEEAAIDDIIMGRPSKNAARYFGNLLGGGGGLGSTLLSAGTSAGGAAAFGPIGAAAGVVPPVMGATARGLANRMSKNELKKLDELIRSRSPLYKNQPEPAAVYQPGGGNVAANSAGRGALAETLIPPRFKIGPNGGQMINGVEYF